MTQRKWHYLTEVKLTLKKDEFSVFFVFFYFKLVFEKKKKKFEVDKLKRQAVSH